MPETFAVADAVELAVVERSGFVESRHAGSAVVLSGDRQVLRSLGDPSGLILPRSCLKPFQAVAVMRSGVELEGAAAVIASASHSGTSAHLGLVRSLLVRAGLTEAALKCPADWPLDAASRDQAIGSGLGKRPIFMNCSGKHAAMLLACAHNGWPTDSYLEPGHPLQVQIADVIERLAGERITTTATDGCGAPAHALSLTGLARGIQAIATASVSSPFALYRDAAALCEAIRGNGWALDGPGRANTVVIDRLGIIAKGGAEGVLVMAAGDGTTVAVKILDGSSRATTAVALQLLCDAGAVDAAAVEAVKAELPHSVLGGGAVVGTIRAAFAS
ncbi:MAG: asparaginase [Microbacteriaceae bacterium]